MCVIEASFSAAMFARIPAIRKELLVFSVLHHVSTELELGDVWVGCEVTRREGTIPDSFARIGPWASYIPRQAIALGSGIVFERRLYLITLLLLRRRDKRWRRLGRSVSRDAARRLLASLFDI